MSAPPAVRLGTRTPSGWVLGRIAGSPVVLAPSWLLVAAFLTVIFLPTVRAGAPGLGTVATVAAAAGFPLLLALSVLLHELGHGLTARRLGIPVTEYVITLWGGHTQFDRELRSPGTSALVSVAGPVVNAVLAAVSWWAAGAADGVVALLLGASAIANGFVAAFNLLPGLPLDGGRVLEAAVWRVTGDRVRGTLAAGWVGRVLAVGVVVVGLGGPLLQGRQPTVVTAITVALVGAFLWTGASQTIRAATAKRAAEGIDLLALAGPAVAVPVEATLAGLDATVPTGVAVVLVTADGRPVALVDPGAAASVPTPLRAGTGLAAVATPLAPATIVTDLRGVAAVRAMGAAQHAGPAAVLVDATRRPPRVLGVVLVARVAEALTRSGRP